MPKGVRSIERLGVIDHFVAGKGCWHYSISPNHDMPVDEFLHALDQFAMNAKIQITASRRHA